MTAEQRAQDVKAATRAIVLAPTDRLEDLAASVADLIADARREGAAQVERVRAEVSTWPLNVWSTQRILAILGPRADAIARGDHPWTDAQEAVDRAHPTIAGSPYCLHDPCPWHAPEARLRQPNFGPAVLVEGDPSLVVMKVAEALAQGDQPHPCDQCGSSHHLGIDHPFRDGEESIASRDSLPLEERLAVVLADEGFDETGDYFARAAVAHRLGLGDGR